MERLCFVGGFLHHFLFPFQLTGVEEKGFEMIGEGKLMVLAIVVD
jgi:hypothetical protein